MKNGKTQEFFSVTGAQIVEKVKDIIKQGNAHRIIIQNEEGKGILEIPIYVGAVGVVCAPVIAAIGVLGALVGKCKIVAVRKNIKKKA